MILRCYEWNIVLIIEKNYIVGNVIDIKFEKKVGEWLLVLFIRMKFDNWLF